VNFNTSNSNIPYDKVNSIEFGSPLNSNGDIFIGTAYGLGVLNIDFSNFPNHTWNSFYEQIDPNTGLIGNDIINIQKNINGDIWICTTNGISILEYNSSLGEFNPEQWLYLNTLNSNIPSNMTRTILFENNGKIWIGTTSGLCTIENDTWEIYNFETQGIYSNNIKKIIQNTENDYIYIGTVNGGYQLYNNNSFLPFNNSNSGLLDNTVNDFLFDNNNNLIITSPSAGLEVLTTTQNWVIFNSATYPELPFFINSLNNIVVDINNNLWISTMENGLIKYSNNNWTFYNEENSGLPDDRINCLTYDESSNRLWIGTENTGVVMLDLNAINNIDIEKENPFKFSFSKDYLNLRSEEKGILKIYNTSGKVILELNIKDTQTTIYTPNLEQGIYIIHFQTASKNISRKIIKLN